MISPLELLYTSKTTSYGTEFLIIILPSIITMSMFLCPLCGKQNSIKNYHSETFDDDVEIFHNASLGYRKGFEKILGFDLDEFPELRAKILNRIDRIAEFLEHAPFNKIEELEQQYIEERNRRISAEEEIVELDLDYLLIKLNRALGERFFGLHSAVDELISREESINRSNQNLRLENQNLQSRYTQLAQANQNLVDANQRFQKENKDLRETIQQWSTAYKNLETQNNNTISKYANELNREKTRSIALEEELEELDLDLLLNLVNDELGKKHTYIYAAITELIHDYHLCENEIEGALGFINDVLPEVYDLYDDLDEALEALYQYYTDQIEELSDDFS